MSNALFDKYFTFKSRITFMQLELLSSCTTLIIASLHCMALSLSTSWVSLCQASALARVDNIEEDRAGNPIS